MNGEAVVRQHADGGLLKARTPLQNLLHALRQPLTGLQCSLELAAAGPRSNEQYRSTLREGLELTARMRVLVEAIGELVETDAPDSREPERFCLDTVVREVGRDMQPVAEDRHIHLAVECRGPLPVMANRAHLSAQLFRLLDSAISMAQEGSRLQIVASPEQRYACLAITWRPGSAPEHSPFSRQELGLMTVQAGWERSGAGWYKFQKGDVVTCTLQLPLAVSSAAHDMKLGDSK